MQNILERAAKVRLLICDVDGVFTDGALFLSEAGEFIKQFNIHDGLGIKMLLQSGVEVAIITSRNVPMVHTRMTSLGIKHIFQGHDNKLVVFEKLCEQMRLREEQIAYVGDDLPDLAIIRRVGLGIAVANAVSLLKQYAHWQTKTKGGFGAVREVCELIMLAQNTLHKMQSAYL